MRRQFEKYVIGSSKYAHWIRIYLSFHVRSVSGPVVYGRPQNPKTSEDPFRHDITPLTISTL